MTPEKKQTGLQRHRDIILAILDYFLATQAGTLLFDKEEDFIAVYYGQQKLQAEEYYRQGRLDRLRQRLASLIKRLQHSADPNVVGYIKEKTGHDVDLFKDLRKRIDSIVAQNKILNKKEQHDVISMLQLYQQTDNEKKLVEKLTALRLEYHTQMYEQDSGKRQAGYINVVKRVVEGDQVIEHGIITNGPKPTHWEFREAISPDGTRRLQVTEWGEKKRASTYVEIIFPKASGRVYEAEGIHPDIQASWKDDATVVIETKKDYPAGTRHNEVRSFNDTVTIEYIEH